MKETLKADELISVVIPCYRSEKTVRTVVEEIRREFDAHPGFACQIILCCDGSPDNTFAEIAKLCEKDKAVTGLLLANNFGQQAAVLAGLSYAAGLYAVVMDDDGQHPAGGIFRLLEALQPGNDVAMAYFPEKKHSGFQRFGSKINDLMARVLINKPKKLRFSSFFAMRAFVVRELMHYHSREPYIQGYFLRVTKNIVNVEMEHRARLQGVSGYTFTKLLRLWLSGFTSFSVVPLRMASALGVRTAGAGVIYAIVIILRKLLNPDTLLGYASTMAALLFIGGMVMVLLGLIGEYVGRSYMALNRLPQYVIKEQIVPQASFRLMEESTKPAG
jgi:undecaprenyl-phosphate 4-deoxy-4-formamido-L-arabinose transferase